MPILGSPPLVVVEAVAAFQSFGVVWHGCDGSTWDMVDPDGGVVLSPDGTRGLGMPTFDRNTVTSPSLPGSRYTGSRTQERTWLWPIFVYADTTTEWLAKQRAFLSSMRPDAKGSLELIQPDASSRFLDLRFVDDNGQTFGPDPAQRAWSLYAVNMVADDNPYWYGPDIVRTFVPPGSVNFFLDSVGVFYISPGGSTADATIPNPGDVNAWPVWTVNGSCSSATLGANGGSVVTPAIGDGDVWTVDTRPSKMTAIDQDGTDHSGEVDWNPAPIPPGTEVELTLDLDTPGDVAAISCSLTPLYFRAF